VQALEKAKQVCTDLDAASGKSIGLEWSEGPSSFLKWPSSVRAGKDGGRRPSAVRSTGPIQGPFRVHSKSARAGAVCCTVVRLYLIPSTKG
jgi:hypothetical protein